MVQGRSFLSTPSTTRASTETARSSLLAARTPKGLIEAEFFGYEGGTLQVPT